MTQKRAKKEREKPNDCKSKRRWAVVATTPNHHHPTGGWAGGHDSHLSHRRWAAIVGTMSVAPSPPCAQFRGLARLRFKSLFQDFFGGFLWQFSRLVQVRFQPIKTSIGVVDQEIRLYFGIQASGFHVHSINSSLSFPYLPLFISCLFLFSFSLILLAQIIFSLSVQFLL